ncbi:MAG: hypothetical protein HXX11_16030 [Desulfuromonadales bacterium]|nr:hypothetical protein [Desulfuromonadales bacterium]
MTEERCWWYPDDGPEETRSREFGSAPPQQAPSDWRTIAKAALISSLLTVAILAVYDNFYAQKIVALDVKGYIAEQRDQFLTGKINEEQLKASFDRLEQVKERVPKNRVIILGDVLVRKNVEEITP